MNPLAMAERNLKYMNMSSPISTPNWKLRLRLWVGVLFLILGGADFFLIRFSFEKFNPAPMLIGLTVLTGLGTKLLLVGLWRRKSWSRSALSLILVMSIMAFSVLLFYVIGEKLPREPGMLRGVYMGMALQAVALWILGQAKSIRRVTHPLTCHS